MVELKNSQKIAGGPNQSGPMDRCQDRETVPEWTPPVTGGLWSRCHNAIDDSEKAVRKGILDHFNKLPNWCPRHQEHAGEPIIWRRRW